MPSRRLRIALIAGLLLAGLAVLAVLLRPVPVPVVEVGTASLLRTLVFTGRVATTSRVEVGSTLTGRVQAVRVREGDDVTAGQPLVQLETEELQAALAQALASHGAKIFEYSPALAVEYGERVTVRWELDDAVSGAEVPALVLQPLVENAVRHGIEANPLGGWIVVRTRVQAGQAVLTVSNSVPTQGPTAATAGHGIALRNVRQRLKLMHDVEADFEAGLQKGEGAQPPIYVVRIAVPLPVSAKGSATA